MPRLYPAAQKRLYPVHNMRLYPNEFGEAAPPVAPSEFIGEYDAASNVIQATGLDLSAFTAVEVILRGVVCTVDDSLVAIQIEVDGSRSHSYYTFNQSIFGGGTAAESQNNTAGTSGGIYLTDHNTGWKPGTDIGEAYECNMKIAGIQSGQLPFLIGKSVHGNSNNNMVGTRFSGSANGVFGAVTGFYVYSTPNNIASGKMIVYGVL